MNEEDYVVDLHLSEAKTIDYSFIKLKNGYIINTSGDGFF